MPAQEKARENTRHKPGVHQGECLQAPPVRERTSGALRYIIAWAVRITLLPEQIDEVIKDEMPETLEGTLLAKPPDKGRTDGVASPDKCAARFELREAVITKVPQKPDLRAIV